jgi:hypothetical protein
MARDGNMVLYHAKGWPCWISHTLGRPGSCLVLQDNGDLVICWPSEPVWTSNIRQPAEIALPNTGMMTGETHIY